MDYLALKNEILAGSFDLQNRDDGAIASALSVGRKQLVSTEVGVGTILETIGIASGNALLDAIKNTPDFRHVWPLIEQGRLRLDSPVTMGALDMLVGAGVITPAEGDAIKSKAYQAQVISANDVAKALEGA